MSPMRYYRPDFRFIYRNLKLYDMERATVRMDTSYDKITKIVEKDSLDETQTASLVQEYTFATSIPLPDKCLYVSYLGFRSTELTNILSSLVKL
jgi:hypothetical protein